MGKAPRQAGPEGARARNLDAGEHHGGGSLMSLEEPWGVPGTPLPRSASGGGGGRAGGASAPPPFPSPPPPRLLPPWWGEGRVA